ncbi:MAG: hypothetical protein EHM91_00415 [Planctomycetota bacterium]|nr:MAG: hypothetical protein EHM91_00415 [Planctomycetota bacterium]
MANYVPSGKVGPVGIGVTLGLGLVAGVVAAALFHLVGRFFYLVLLFPILWGLGIGMAVAMGVRIGKCRNSVVGIAAGLVAAVASFGVFQVLENRHVKSTFDEYLAKEVKVNVKDSAVAAQFDKAYDEYLLREHGGTGFMAQLSVRAGMGMNISRRGRSGKDGKPMITGAGMYVYWFVELAIIAGMCGLLSLGATRSAFCEKCEEWYESKELAGIVSGRTEQVRQAIVSKDYGRLPTLIVRTNPGGALSVEKCPKCSAAPVVVKIESITTDDKGKESRSTDFEEMISAAAATAMESALTTPSAPGPAAT